MSEAKWEKFKMKEKYWYVSLDELVMFALGAFVFAAQLLQPY